MQTTKRLEIKKALVDQLWRQILIEFPHEAGALLYGDSTNGVVKLSHARVLPNRARDLNTLSASLDHFDHPIALFHTHRQDASLSLGDLSKMKNDTLIWIIARSGHPPTGRKFLLKAYQWRTAEAVEIDIKETKS